MSLPLSGSQIDKLGTRIRDAAEVDEDDLRLLQGLLLAHNDALSEVATRLQGLGLAPTTRLKTSGTIRDKLRRESPITLRSIRDLAGARVVRRMTLDEQDRVIERIHDLWPDAKTIDRRKTPSYGYRAFHFIPRVNGCYVEIQIRTLYQDTWAQVMEMLGDVWGRAIRYGGPPDDPDAPVSAGPHTRRQIIDAWISQSANIAELEIQETARERLAGALDNEEAAELDATIEASYGSLRSLLREVRDTLKLS